MTGATDITSTLDSLADAIASVSPDWASKIARGACSSAGCSSVRGFESIREGWLLHRGQSRLVPGASPDLALLIGDWCYAAGLREITEHGSLDDVAVLADLIAAMSTQSEVAIEDLTPQWADAQRALERKIT